MSTQPPPSSTPPPLLDAEALACRRGDRILFRGLNLRLDRGQVLWLRGSNGRGKTSLLRLLAGLSRPESGSVRRGTDVAYLAHHNALKEDLTAIESLAFLARLHGQDGSRDRLIAALSRIGLASRRDAPVRTLSQGQRRRVALARLLLQPAKPLWLLDEPYDALDSTGVEIVDELLSLHARRGGGVLLTSHLAMTLADPAPIEFSLDEAVVRSDSSLPPRGGGLGRGASALRAEPATAIEPRAAAVDGAEPPP